jgi:3-deoxy-D-manno-octulosonate 8-phosphate phosphatase (KDO 8-P phosphatase)
MTDADINARFAQVRLISLDCDGVMTDGGLYYGPAGDEMRRFHVRDGVGIKALINAGVAVAFVTASRTPAITARAQALGVRHCLVGVETKLAAITELGRELSIRLDEIAHMGDDENDLEVLRAVGLAMTVADAIPEVLKAAAYVTRRRGGDGAVREMAEQLLAARRRSIAANPPDRS